MAEVGGGDAETLTPRHRVRVSWGCGAQHTGTVGDTPVSLCADRCRQTYREDRVVMHQMPNHYDVCPKLVRYMSITPQ